MYKIVNKIPKNFDVKKHSKPVITMEDEYGGQSVVIIDDHCFVLMNGSEDKEFKMVHHWYPEVVFALTEIIITKMQKNLTDDPDDKFSWENKIRS